MCQVWQPQLVSAGWYALQNVEGSFCLDVERGVAADGVAVNGYQCSLADNQLWQFTCAANDEWQLTSQRTGKVLQVASGGLQVGAVHVQWTNNGAPEQRFTLEHRSEVFSALVATSEQAPGQTWRTTQSNPPGSWATEAFDDSVWAEGPGVYGDGGNPFATVRTDWSSSNRIWMRSVFNLASVPATLDMRLLNTCATEIHVNGTLIHISTFDTTNYARIGLDSGDLSAFKVGANTLAISCQQASFERAIDVGFGSYSW
jgi:hypothetical protein